LIVADDNCEDELDTESKQTYHINEIIEIVVPTILFITDKTLSITEYYSYIQFLGWNTQNPRININENIEKTVQNHYQLVFVIF